MTRCQINNPEDCFGPCPCGERNVAPPAPVASQPAASGVDALWVEEAMSLAEHLETEAILYGGAEPESNAETISLRGMLAARESLRAHLSTALTGAAKEVK